MPLDFFQIDEGTAILVVGLLAIVGAIVVTLRNYAAGAFWGISVILLVWSGTFGLELEYFWVSFLLTLVLVVAGFVVRGAA